PARRARPTSRTPAGSPWAESRGTETTGQAGARGNPAGTSVPALPRVAALYLLHVYTVSQEDGHHEGAREALHQRRQPGGAVAQGLPLREPTRGADLARGTARDPRAGPAAMEPRVPRPGGQRRRLPVSRRAAAGRARPGPRLTHEVPAR